MFDEFLPTIGKAVEQIDIRPGSFLNISRHNSLCCAKDGAFVILIKLRYSNPADPDALIFANRKGKIISDMTISQVMRTDDMPWVPHGFRTSLRTWAAEQQPYIPEAVAEAALSHVIDDEVVKAYQRATLLEMRRMLLDQWGGFITGGDWIAVPPRPLASGQR